MKKRVEKNEYKKVEGWVKEEGKTPNEEEAAEDGKDGKNVIKREKRYREDGRREEGKPKQKDLGSKR